MSTDLTWQTGSDSSGQTEQLALKIAKRFRGGEIVELISDLGGGKTTFAKGLARGIGSSDHVSSPTFKISNVYKGSELTMYHFDFYRLHGDALIEHELHDALEDSSGVIVIEWGERLSLALNRPTLKIHLKTTGDSTRHVSLTAPKQLAYILEAVQ